MTRRHRAAAPAVLVVLALTAGACGGDGDDAAATTTSTTATTAPATTSTDAVTTTAEPGCGAVSVPAGATDAAEATGDVDGDGADDVLHSYRVGESAWHLQVALAAGGGADLPVPTLGEAAVVVLGGADVDGDGGEEVWARTGAGASATILGLARLVGCELVRVTFASGEPAELPVGGSVGTASGVSCDGALDPAAHLTTHTARNTGDVEYEVTSTRFTLEGTVLVQGASEVATATMGDELFARATGFSCGELFSP